jgi:glycosyltransferase involved in cell wall biosynthesis
MKQKRILLVYLGYSTFVREDDHILSAHFSVEKYHYKASKKPIHFATEMIRQFVYCLFNTYRFDILYIWFSDYHSFIPALFGRLFGKKVVVVVGGQDAVSIPQIAYGVFYKKNLRYALARLSYKLANLILPVDQSLIKGRNFYADPTGMGYAVGVKHYAGNVKADFIVLPTGYDASNWRSIETINRENAVITIATANTQQTYVLKGLDMFVEMARMLPQTSFTLIGLGNELAAYVETIKPQNLNIVGFVPNEQLPEWLSAHKVFAQLSLSEGLPNTLCEAMLCECIPVGTNVNGIPAAIGETGFIVFKNDIYEAKHAIESALNDDTNKGIQARNRIIQLFPKKQRHDKLSAILHQL